MEIVADPVPLRVNADGVVLVGRTRVPINTVIYTYKSGCSPEEIAEQYTALKIADIYAVISYYLRHKEEVDAYIKASEERSAEARAKYATPVNMDELRERWAKQQSAGQRGARVADLTVFYPTRLSFISDGYYELEIADQFGTPQLLTCTLIEGEINAVSFDPDPFMWSSTDIGLIVKAIRAFDRARKQKVVSLPTSGSDR